MVETHDAFLAGPALERLLAAAPAVELLWDAHHTWRKAGEAPAETWRAIRGRTVHVHVKDSVPVPSARHPFTYVRPGEGGFPILELRAVLERDGYGGAVSLEWERQWHPYLPPLEEALQAMTERGWW
jgi:sugar phosphate isomerase/epimerase